MFVIYCFFPLLLVFGIPLTILLDKLMVRFHRDHHAEWKGAGGPIGGFWKPPEYGWMSGVLKGQLARERCVSAWVKATPDWIQSNAINKKLWTGYIICRRIFWLSLLIAVFAWAALRG